MEGQTQTLYRKWRSQTFRDLVGQDAIVQTLHQAVATQRLTHAYLFSGPRGTGKTSMARLLAKMVNCEHPAAGEPCNECFSCREITEGRSTDVYEIDAASNRGIDEIRDLRERVRVSSAIGRVRFYIIDEVHMLTTEAFNALLKTLEEPPPRVIFVLATTESHKVPATVVSRCQRFDFHRITMRDIVGRLRYVADQEAFAYEPESLEIIARAAQGGMRDAMSLLDQAHAFCGDGIHTVDVRSMLGMADPTLIQDLVRFVAINDSSAGLHRIYELVQGGSDVRQVMTQVTELWRQLLLARAGADIVQILDIAAEEAAVLQSMAQHYTVAQIAECARIFSRTDGTARVQVIPQLQLELAFLDCVAAVHSPAQPVQSAQTTASAAQQAPQPTSIGSARVPESLSPPQPAPAQAYSKPETGQIPAAFKSVESLPAPLSDAGTPGSILKDAIPPVYVPAATGSSSLPDETTILSHIQRDWEIVCKVASQRKDNTYALMKSARPYDVTISGKPTIVLAMENALLLKKLNQPEKIQILIWSINQVMNFECDVQLIQIEKQEQPAQRPHLAIVEAKTPWQKPATISASPSSMKAMDPAQMGTIGNATQAAEPITNDEATDPLAIARRDPVIRQVLQEYNADLIEIIDESDR